MRSTVRPRAAVGAAGAVLLVAVVGAALGHPWALEERHYGSLNWKLGSNVPTPPPMPSRSPAPERTDSSSSGGVAIDMQWIAYAVLAVLAVAAAVVLWRLWQRFRRTAAPAAPQQAPGAGGVSVEDQAPELPALLEAARTARRSLERIADSDDAIIAAWLAVEDGAAASGVVRYPAQTATEFTLAVLSRTDADPAAIAQLRGLYLLARFSSHGAGPGDVDQAARCLEALAATWDVPAARATT